MCPVVPALPWPIPLPVAVRFASFDPLDKPGILAISADLLALWNVMNPVLLTGMVLLDTRGTWTPAGTLRTIARGTDRIAFIRFNGV